ncbi:hypothetical protein PV05_11126 [Exophiala xenobiotica]|uniref:DUF1996 domain-containing protein n=1 Tax=Exophiala xenobiotica TaxID=348802 RepID=A0A0D2E1Y2_9EURO|nr:uncharacterized protein PV05_11126 [Exophiala xenobiotica]KIW49448.1 hypothetical protein PV05_11126 [Exophiala xenobiotica]
MSRHLLYRYYRFHIRASSLPLLSRTRQPSSSISLLLPNMKALPFTPFLGLLALQPQLSAAYWRMACSISQTARVDPILNPGGVASHVHKFAGGNNVNANSDHSSLLTSTCSSCEVQADLSAYWTPQLYFAHSDGVFEEVPNYGMTVYYVGRGGDTSNTVAFPSGLKMISGDTTARSYDTSTLTYLNTRPVADRVSFRCINEANDIPETHYLNDTDCVNGLRAQINFQSCWDGVNLYLEDSAHVAYLSNIDSGVCPPSHPVPIPGLFFEVLYFTNDIDQSAGGEFVFANGDPTGYGYHADFMNGWDMDVLDDAVANCLYTDVDFGVPSACPYLVTSDTSDFARLCPEEPSVLTEAVHGNLTGLPGCNPISWGPESSPQNVCPVGQVTPLNATTASASGSATSSTTASSTLSSSSTSSSSLATTMSATDATTSTIGAGETVTTPTSSSSSFSSSAASTTDTAVSSVSTTGIQPSESPAYGDSSVLQSTSGFTDPIVSTTSPILSTMSSTSTTAPSVLTTSTTMTTAIDVTTSSSATLTSDAVYAQDPTSGSTSTDAPNSGVSSQDTAVDTITSSPTITDSTDDSETTTVTITDYVTVTVTVNGDVAGSSATVASSATSAAGAAIDATSQAPTLTIAETTVTESGSTLTIPASTFRWRDGAWYRGSRVNYIETTITITVTGSPVTVAGSTVSVEASTVTQTMSIFSVNDNMYTVTGSTFTTFYPAAEATTATASAPIQSTSTSTTDNGMYTITGSTYTTFTSGQASSSVTGAEFYTVATSTNSPSAADAASTITAPASAASTGGSIYTVTGSTYTTFESATVSATTDEVTSTTTLFTTTTLYVTVTPTSTTTLLTQTSSSTEAFSSTDANIAPTASPSIQAAEASSNTTLSLITGMGGATSSILSSGGSEATTFVTVTDLITDEMTSTTQTTLTLATASSNTTYFTIRGREVLFTRR